MEILAKPAAFGWRNPFDWRATYGPCACFEGDGLYLAVDVSVRGECLMLVFSIEKDILELTKWEQMSNEHYWALEKVSPKGPVLLDIVASPSAIEFRLNRQVLVDWVAMLQGECLFP